MVAQRQAWGRVWLDRDSPGFLLAVVTQIEACVMIRRPAHQEIISFTRCELKK